MIIRSEVQGDSTNWDGCILSSGSLSAYDLILIANGLAVVERDGWCGGCSLTHCVGQSGAWSL